jgi:pimeloyl-ACP methyl ester carboxylesterase
LTLTLTISASAGAPQIGKPIPDDPPPDARNPARLDAVWIPSGGVRMNGVMYVAAGAQPHPTAVIFHGLPGNEQNLDLAQTLRSAGFNVLTFHYRGSWGSPGKFSLANGVADGHAALEFLGDANTVAKFDIEPGRLLLIGHSYGGFVAAAHPGIFGAVLIAPWNLGDDIAFLKVPEAHLPEVAHKMFDDIEGPAWRND